MKVTICADIGEALIFHNVFNRPSSLLPKKDSKEIQKGRNTDFVGKIKRKPSSRIKLIYNPGVMGNKYCFSHYEGDDS